MHYNMMNNNPAHTILQNSEQETADEVSLVLLMLLAILWLNLDYKAIWLNFIRSTVTYKQSVILTLQ